MRCSSSWLNTMLEGLTVTPRKGSISISKAWMAQAARKVASPIPPPCHRSLLSRIHPPLHASLLTSHCLAGEDGQDGSAVAAQLPQGHR